MSESDLGISLIWARGSSTPWNFGADMKRRVTVNGFVGGKWLRSDRGRGWVGSGCAVAMFDVA